MPCDSIILNRVDLPKMNLALREKAILAMGAVLFNNALEGTGFYYNGQRYLFQNGALVGPDASIADLLKRHYSVQVTKLTARKAGWTLKQVGPFEYEATK